MLIHFDEWLSILSKRGIFVLATLLVALLGWLDYATGFEITFSFFYLFPITLAIWYFGYRAGLVITCMGVLTWLVSNWLAGQTYSNEWIRLFNAAVRLAAFSGIAYLLHELKTAYNNERTLSRIDFLTGVFNRREFTEQLELEVNRAKRLDYPITLAYIDIDNFKVINNEEGHKAGDTQLKLIAQTIMRSVRKTDVFARLGGDEFGLLLPNVNQANAKQVLKKIEKAVSQEMNHANSPVTLSMGVITFNAPPVTTDDLLQMADILMYEAKQSGKNRTYYKEVD